MACHQRTAKNDLNPNGGPGFCSKVTVTFTFAKRRIYLVMSAPSGWGDCKLLRVKASAAGTLGNSWEFMQKCSERILPRLGMWSCQRKKLFRDEHGIQGGFRIGISKREKQSRVVSVSKLCHCWGVSQKDKIRIVWPFVVWWEEQ